MISEALIRNSTLTEVNLECDEKEEKEMRRKEIKKKRKRERNMGVV